MTSSSLSLSLFPTKKVFVPKTFHQHLLATKPFVPKPLKPISAVYSATPFTDRLISAASYTLPLLNSLSYGRFLFSQYPAIGTLISPIAPLLTAYRSVPYASFVAFFALYLGVARNTSLSHFCYLKPILAVYSPTPFLDRLISAGLYTLPLLNSLSYGRFLFAQYHALASRISHIALLLNAYRNVPYASFVAFFALYLGIARNTSLSLFVRFNAMQALMLDVALVIPQLVIRIVGNPGRGVGYKLMVMGHNAVFVFMIMCFVYSFVSSVLGKTPYLPLVADAAGRQLPQ